MNRATRVIAAIDDAHIIQQRNPVLFARASNAGCDCLTLARLYDAWNSGYSGIRSMYGAFNVSAATAGRAKIARRRGKAARAARRGNRA